MLKSFITKVSSCFAMLAAMLIIAMNCSCSRTDSNDRLEDMLDYVGDDASIIATADLTLLTGAGADETDNGHGQPVLPIKVLSHFCPVVEDIVSTMHDYKGLDLHAAIAVSYSASLPDDSFAVIVPVTDKDLAVRSFKSRRYNSARASNGKEVFRRQASDGMAIMIEDGYAWFLFDTEPSLLVKNVSDIIAKGKGSKIADWKRDMLLAGNAATALVKHKVGNLDGEYTAFSFTSKGDDSALSGRVLNASGEVTTFDKPENFRYIDHEALSKLSGNSFACAAFALPKGTEGRRIADAVLDNPEAADAETDSLRSIVTRFVNNVDGTMAMSLSFSGNELFDLEAYRLDFACRMLPGTAAGTVNSIGRFISAMGLPASAKSAGSISYDLGDLTLKVYSGNDNYLRATAAGGSNNAAGQPHPIDSENLIGYMVIDLPSNSPLVKAMANDMRLQMQMRVTPSGFNINLSANEDALNMLTSLSALNSVPSLLVAPLLFR
jgi:hypothetical protein